jgi:hypothetical protein
MIGRVPRHTSLGDDLDPGGLFVFIPGAIASGFLIPLGLLAGDAFRSVRGDAGTTRRVTNSGAVIADEVRDGARAGRRTTTGLRHRSVYGVVSLLSFAIVALAVPGATWNFMNPVGYISDIAWIWAVSMIAVVGFAVLGVQSLRLAPEWMPIIVAILGVGMAARFALGDEPEAIGGVLVGLGLLIATIGPIATWRARRHAGVTDVPPSVRPLLTRTPLSRSK